MQIDGMIQFLSLQKTFRNFVKFIEIKSMELFQFFQHMYLIKWAKITIKMISFVHIFGNVFAAIYS